MSWLIKTPLILIAVFVVAGYALSLFARRPETLGVSDGQLSPAPDSPNCVSTQTESTSHQMSPISIPDGRESDALAEAANILEEMGGQIVTRESDYIHLEFTSLVFRYVDDVEVFIPVGGPVHFRSASRSGHSDMGVNRKRMTKFTRQFQKSLVDLPKHDSAG